MKMVQNKHFYDILSMKMVQNKHFNDNLYIKMVQINILMTIYPWKWSK